MSKKIIMDFIEWLYDTYAISEIGVMYPDDLTNEQLEQIVDDYLKEIEQ